jgi:fatty acid desaturase
MMDWVRNNIPDILSIFAALAGYGALLIGLHSIVEHQAVWWLGAGMLLVGVFGWRLSYEVLVDGVYGTWVAQQENEET